MTKLSEKKNESISNTFAASAKCFHKYNWFIAK